MNFLKRKQLACLIAATPTRTASLKSRRSKSLRKKARCAAVKVDKVVRADLVKAVLVVKVVKAVKAAALPQTSKVQ